MSFIRIKQIKGKNYAYIVENKWRKRGKKPKQKFRKYLGRVFTHEKVNEHDFFEHYNIADKEEFLKSNPKCKVINDLVRLELLNHGFEERGSLLVKNNIYFSYDKGLLFSRIQLKKANNKKPIEKNSNKSNFLKNNKKQNKEISTEQEEYTHSEEESEEVMANNYKINKNIVLQLNEGFLCNETIKRLKSEFTGTEQEVGYKMAKAFVEAGINVPKELFVMLFEKEISD